MFQGSYIFEFESFSDLHVCREFAGKFIFWLPLKKKIFFVGFYFIFLFLFKIFFCGFCNLIIIHWIVVHWCFAWFAITLLNCLTVGLCFRVRVSFKRFSLIKHIQTIKRCFKNMILDVLNCRFSSCINTHARAKIDASPNDLSYKEFEHGVDLPIDF